MKIKFEGKRKVEGLKLTGNDQIVNHEGREKIEKIKALLLAIPSVDQESIQEKRRMIQDKLEGYNSYDTINAKRENEFDGLEKREHLILLEQLKDEVEAGEIRAKSLSCSPCKPRLLPKKNNQQQ